MKLKDTAAVITGGASGLGAATAALLVARGAKVAIFDLDAALGAGTAASLGCSFFTVDVGDETSVAAGLDAAAAECGPARILVNCAGIAPAQKTVGREFQPHALDLYRKVIGVNLIGTFNVISKFAARASKLDALGEERGVIVNTASVAAYDGQVGQAAYSASKGGIVGMTLPIARDLAQYAIRVVTIAPGLFLTPLLKGLPETVRESLGKQVPFPSRLGDPSEYAMLVESVISNPMLNGETIRLDGAIRMAPR